MFRFAVVDFFATAAIFYLPQREKGHVPALGGSFFTDLMVTQARRHLSRLVLLRRPQSPPARTNIPARLRSDCRPPAATSETAFRLRVTHEPEGHSVSQSQPKTVVRRKNPSHVPSGRKDTFSSANP